MRSLNTPYAVETGVGLRYSDDWGMIVKAAPWGRLRKRTIEHAKALEGGCKSLEQSLITVQLLERSTHRHSSPCK